MKHRQPDKRTIKVQVTTKDLANLYGVTERTVRRWIDNGELAFTGNPIEDLITVLSNVNNIESVTLKGQQYLLVPVS